MAEQSRVGGGRLPSEAFAVYENARRAIVRHRMLAEGDTVLVAVSGGPDSTCLLDVMLRLAAARDYAVEVAHVDHGLSTESSRVAANVAHAAAEKGLEVHVVTAPHLEGPNLHARARDFRYAFFEAIANDIGAAAVATGHTLDDRVETTLARLIHGAGTDGLAGLPPNQDGRVRPLIDVRRSETHAYCRAAGLDFFSDPSNSDPRFERAIVRERVVAPIEEAFGEGAIKAMAASADRLAEDAAALRGLAATAYEHAAQRTDDDDVAFEAKAFRALPRAFQRRLLEAAVGQVRDRAGGIDAALAALDGPVDATERRFAVASGLEIVLTRERLQVSRRMPS